METKTLNIEGFIDTDGSDYGETVIKLKEDMSKYDGETLFDLISYWLESIKVPAINTNFQDWQNGDYYFLGNIFLRFYIVKEKTTWKEIEKEHIEQIAGTLKLSEHFEGYSEFTITDSWSDFFVGDRDIQKILEPHKGKYLLMKVSVKVKAD